MRTTKRFLGLLAVIAAMLALEGSGWSQCAMCRTALENSVEGQQIAQGFQHGIIFLLAAPYAILGSITYGVARAFKKRQSGLGGRN